MSERLRQAQGPRWPGAKAAIEKVRGQKLPSLFGDDFTRRAAETAVTEMALKDMDARDCSTASELLGSVAPLPAENFGRLFSVLVEIAVKEDAKTPFRLCRGQAA